MVSLFSSLNIASNALSVNESAISVVSHNVANMNTEGYSKQKVNLATRNIAGTIGDNVEAQVRSNGGVMIANVMRYNDGYLNNYYRNQLSKLRDYEQQLDNIGGLANVFNDLDGKGIDAALSKFYEALNNLNEYPASSTARVNFIETSRTLTSILQGKSTQLDELTAKALGDGESEEALLNSKIYNQYGIFNDKLKELAEVNRALQITQTGTLQANNLLDKRDMILNDIAEFVDINVQEKFNGSVNLYVGDVALVKGAKVCGELDIQTAASYCKANDLTYPDDWYAVDEKGNKYAKPAAVMSIVSYGENGSKEVIQDYANDIIQGGALGGMLHSADLQAEGMNVGKAQLGLNKLAQAIAQVFNDLNTREGAYCINPNNTGELKATDENNLIFVANDGSTDVTAKNISINPALLLDDGCWNLSCAYFSKDENFDIRAVGNSQNVIEMLETRNLKMDGVDGRPDLNGMSIEDYYTGLLGKVAAAGGNAQSLVDTQQDVVDAIENELAAKFSVDLNEELVDLVKYQTAYAASAQVFNVVNSCLDSLMRLGG